MEDQARQFRIVVVNKSRQQGVVEPTQGGIRGHAAHLHVVMLRAQLVGICERLFLAVIATVADAAGDGKTPLQRLQRQFRRGHHVPQHEGAPQRGVVLVAAIVGQIQLADGKAANLLRLGQAHFQARLGGRVIEPVADGARTGPQRILSLRRLRVVAQLRAAAQRQAQHADKQAGRPARHGQPAFSTSTSVS